MNLNEYHDYYWLRVCIIVVARAVVAGCSPWSHISRGICLSNEHNTLDKSLNSESYESVQPVPRTVLVLL